MKLLFAACAAAPLVAASPVLHPAFASMIEPAIADDRQPDAFQRRSAGDSRGPRGKGGPSSMEGGRANDDDLGIRFAKFGEVTGEVRSVTFPMSKDSANWLRANTQAISTIHHTDCINCFKRGSGKGGKPEDKDKGKPGNGILAKFRDYIVNDVGLTMPNHPARDADAPYWDDLRKVVAVQEGRVAGASVESWFPLPDLWSGFTVEEVATAVRNELPGRWHMALLEKFLAEGVQWTDVAPPSLGLNDFLRREVMLTGLNGAVINHVAPTNFQLKWAVGRARPEEVAWQIHEGVITEEDGVPTDLVERIQAMQLQDAPDFTAYKGEGSPMHPSWPAMHSAGSSGSLWMATVMDLTDEQLCEARKLDYAIAFARTVAGVHYEDDNIAGLELGYKIVGDFVPDYLKEHYGADKKAVQERVERFRGEVNWRTFLESDCAKGTI